MTIIARHPIVFTTTWVVVLVAYIIFGAYVSCMSNAKHTTLWIVLGVLMGFIPIWTVVARFSSNVAADGLLYDGIVAVLYYPALLYFSGTLSTMTVTRWAGFLVALLGIVLTRI